MSPRVVPPTSADLRQAAERFWSKVERTDACWEWQAYVDKTTGYGQFGVGRRLKLAHRFAYEITYGPIPDGLYVCHQCDNRCCVRPSHLFVGTAKDNAQDAVAKGRVYRPFGVGKLPADAVATIRREYQPPVRRGRGYTSNAKALAERFGITPQYVTQLVARKWRTTDG